MNKFAIGVTVTFTGIIIVFAMLVLLVCVLLLFGRITQSIQKRSDRKKQVNVVTDPKPAVHKPPVVTPPVKNDGEIIAVIAAAVASLYEDSPVKPVIKSVKRANVRPAWGAAGLADNTRPF